MEAIKFISTVRRMSIALAMNKANNEALPALPLPPPPATEENTHE